jgi:deoxycitidine kinase/deoxyguanosine kinase
MFSKSDIIAILQRLVSSDLVDESNPLKIHSGPSNNRTSENKTPFVVSLEGNIGAGKSTLLEKMRQIYLRKDSESEKYFGKLAEHKILFMPEPVDIWTSVCDSKTGESILEKFYKDPKQYAFAFQVMVYNTHLEAFRKIVRENPDCVLLICERSIDAGRHIFAEMLYDDGMIDDVCFKVYKNLYNSTVNEFPLDAILHLDVEPTICLERIGKRAREGEAGIPLEYLEKCDSYYRKWFSNI